MSDIAGRVLRTALAAYDASYPPGVLGLEPDPRITGVSPASISAAAGPTTLTVTGTSFTAASVIEIDQVAQTTTYVNATTLTTSWDPTTSGPVAITVREGTGESNSWPYNVTALFTVTTEESDMPDDDMTTENVPPEPEQPEAEPTGPGEEIPEPFLQPAPDSDTPDD
jgi:hypothetical protein